MDFKSAQQFLDGRMSYERLNNFEYDDGRMNLQRFRDFLQRAGIEFEKLKYVHVAGSKGKGSVSSMFSQYFEKKGLKVGLFTSPHIHSVRERVKLNNLDISEEKFAEYIEKLKPFVENETYFELMNALAFAYFVDEAVDFAVIEVGLGGRLDSTNVILPELSVITRLEMEHAHILGDTLEKIATEKLGIVKEGVPVVIGKQSEEGNEIVRRLCPRADFVDVEGNVFVQNAGLVSLGLKKIGQFVQELFVRMLDDFAMKGRFDVYEIDGKKVIFDIAHTPSSIYSVLERVQQEFGDDFGVLISILQGKDVSKIVEIVEAFTDKILCTNSHDERSIEAEALASNFHSAEFERDPHKALGKALSSYEILLVTGSNYLLEKVMPK